MNANDYKWRLIIGPVLLFAGIVIGILLEGVPSIVVSILTVAGAIFTVNGIRILKYGDIYKRDERTKKLGAYAAAYSWWLTYVAIAVLFWVDYTRPGLMPVSSVLGILMFFMAVTSIIAKRYYFRKGDVE